MKDRFKIMKIILIILIISLVCIFIKMPISYAVFVPPESELPARRGQVEPDNPQTKPEPTNTQEVIKWEYIDHYTSISGNVHEILSDSIIENEKTPRDAKPFQIPIEGVTVSAGGKTVETKSNGDFTISGLPNGTYNLTFCYGYLQNPDAQTSEQIEKNRNILKYNGHDYIAAEVPGKQSYPYSSTNEIEIVTSASGCEQVMILVDHSGSVREGEIEVDGQKRKKIDVIVESTKKLIDSLISSGKNIYIGLVFFSGECFRAQSLTNNADILKAKLDKIKDFECFAGTDLVSALKKAQDSFVYKEKDANRHVIVISDGIPLKAEEVLIYPEDVDDGTYIGKLEEVKRRSRNTIIQLMNNGIKVKSLYLKPDNNEEKDYIDEVFQNANGVYYKMMDGDKFIKEITDSMKTELISTIQEKSYQEYIEITAGYEDEGRRQQVDNNFNRTFTYNNLF